MDGDDVPDDFPRGTMCTVVAGVTPKVCVRLSNGVYRADQSEEEYRERWLVCEDLAWQLIAVAEKDALSHPEQPPQQTLERVKLAVRAKNWLSASELEWLARRLQALLAW